MSDPIVIELELFQECAIFEPLDPLDQIFAQAQELDTVGQVSMNQKRGYDGLTVS